MWKTCLNQALAELNEAPLYDLSASGPTSNDCFKPTVRNVEYLQIVSSQYNLILDMLQVDVDSITADFFISFNAMDQSWLRQYGVDKRIAIINRAMELAKQQVVEVQTVRVRVTKLQHQS